MILSLTASQTCVLPTTCSCSLHRWSSSQKMMCDFKQSTERVGWKIHQDKTKIFSNQSTHRRKEVEISNIKVEMLPAWESAAAFVTICTSLSLPLSNTHQRLMPAATRDTPRQTRLLSADVWQVSVRQSNRRTNTTKAKVQ